MTRAAASSGDSNRITPLTRDTFCALGIHSPGCGCAETHFPVSRPGSGRVELLDLPETLKALAQGAIVLPRSWADVAERSL